jgi:hypothetical protein
MLLLRSKGAPRPVPTPHPETKSAKRSQFSAEPANRRSPKPPASARPHAIAETERSPRPMPTPTQNKKCGTKPIFRRTLSYQPPQAANLRPPLLPRPKGARARCPPPLKTKNAERSQFSAEPFPTNLPKPPASARHRIARIERSPAPEPTPRPEQKVRNEANFRRTPRNESHLPPTK